MTHLGMTWHSEEEEAVAERHSEIRFKQNSRSDKVTTGQSNSCHEAELVYQQERQLGTAREMLCTDSLSSF